MNPARTRLLNGPGTLDKLALSIVLPGDYEPTRFPTLPVSLTSVVSFRTTGINFALGAATRRLALFRDAAYPFWGDRACASLAAYATYTGAVNDVGDSMSNNVITRVDGVVGVTPTIDSVATTADQVCDLMPIARIGRSHAFYVPPGSYFCAEATLTTTAVDPPLTAEIQMTYYVNMEPRNTTVQMVPVSAGSFSFRFVGIANSATASTGSVVTGHFCPVGFVTVECVSFSTLLSVGANDVYTLKVGWVTGGDFTTPASSKTFFLPLRVPAEFATSDIPYTQARTNASALLMTNVTSILNKEGTVQGARLLGNTIDPWYTSEAILSAVHQKYRYYGPLEKGLYTFTTPSNHGTEFFDHSGLIANNGALHTTRRPIFNPENLASYNAIMAVDVVTGNTVLACSVWNHMEFITSSSLFEQETSRHQLQALHTAETAILHLGMFHENPTHFAAIGSMAMKALRFVAPMALPYVEAGARKLVDMGMKKLEKMARPAPAPPPPAKKASPPPRKPGGRPVRKTVAIKRR